jgi:DNA-binding IclR family transcriptional regulator
MRRRGEEASPDRAVSTKPCAEGGQWELGGELFRLASLVQTKRPFRAATSTLRELSRRTGETSLLAVHDPAKHRRMFVTAALSTQSVRFVPDLYSWLPMHAGASALAILAFRPEEETLRARSIPNLRRLLTRTVDESIN